MIWLLHFLLASVVFAQADPQDPVVNPKLPPPDQKSAAEELALESETSQIENIYEDLRFQVPDPVDARLFIAEQLDSDLQPDEREFYNTALNYIDQIDRPVKFELTLPEAIQRAMSNSYVVAGQSYAPAIESTRVVEAEAVFDAVFFANANFNDQNSPAFTDLQAGNSSVRQFDGGIRKLLPTGAAVTTGLRIIRQARDLEFDAQNPTYFTQWNATINQPLLRGFGIDVNRAGIVVAQNNRKISEYTFERDLRDFLVSVERGYWELVAARRSVVISARLIAEFQRKYDALYARKDFDVTKAELTDAKSRLDAQIADYVQVRNSVFDSEDNLKNLLNDPELNIVDQVEILVTEFPTAEPIIIDRLAELQTGLDRRSEIAEAELAISTARVILGQSKNQALPRFDAVFTYTFDALGVSYHDAWQNLGDIDFHSWTVGLQFEWPIGNRGARSAIRRARLEHDRAVMFLKSQIEQIILDVEIAIRDLYTSYERIGADLQSVKSQIEQVRALEERAETQNPDQLNRELNARSQLGAARQQLLQSLITYNFAIAGLERAKGTLLEYNNVSIIKIGGAPQSTSWGRKR